MSDTFILYWVDFVSHVDAILPRDLRAPWNRLLSLAKRCCVLLFTLLNLWRQIVGIDLLCSSAASPVSSKWSTCSLGPTAWPVSVHPQPPGSPTLTIGMSFSAVCQLNHILNVSCEISSLTFKCIIFIWLHPSHFFSRGRRLEIKQTKNKCFSLIVLPHPPEFPAIQYFLVL